MLYQKLSSSNYGYRDRLRSYSRVPLTNCENAAKLTLRQPDSTKKPLALRASPIRE